MTFIYPPAPRHPIVDDYHGTLVADPYRWLEDPDTPETRAFVRAQNEVSFPYLASLAERAVLRDRMTRLWNVPRTGAPTLRSGTAVWVHNDGLQDQPCFYVRSGEAEPRLLLDPNRLSADGAVAVVTTSLAPDGAHWAYSLSEAGSDWQVIRVRDTRTGKDLPDELRHVKFTSVAWHADGFFYARFPAPAPGSTAPSQDQAVYFHRLGTGQEDDTLVFANRNRPDLGYLPIVSHDDRHLVLIEWEGTSPENGLLYRPVTEDGSWIRLASLGVARHDFLAHHGGGFVVLTDDGAPNGRIVRIPLERPAAREEVIAEGAGVIEYAAAAAGHLALVRLGDASHRLELWSPDGTPAGEVRLPGPGTVSELSGKLDEPDLFIGCQSFLHPPTALRWRSGAVAVFAGADPPLEPERVIVERRHAVSTDGADVGMFLLRATDTTLPAPVELYGYGGFNTSLTPQFDPARLAFLEEGGVVAVANLRGGSELGEEWHRAGMLANKQQVFDDFMSCATTLVEDGIAAPGGVGIRGRSNGGLLTAAVMVQRPELFGAVVSTVPVADMLRYQHFTAGRYWTVEYGDAAEPEAFAWLIAYSPYHNVQTGVRYPPLLITTAESDDRVVPMHALKLAAAIQHAAGGRSDQPLLARIDTRAGHGLGKPTSKLIEESADVYGFLLHHLRASIAGPEHEHG